MQSTGIYNYKVRFSAGRAIVTPATAAATELAKVRDILLRARHIHGDWGDMNECERQQNGLAVLPVLCILSRYLLPTGLVIRVVTEIDCSVITIGDTNIGGRISVNPSGSLLSRRSRQHNRCGADRRTQPTVARNGWRAATPGASVALAENRGGQLAGDSAAAVVTILSTWSAIGIA